MHKLLQHSAIRNVLGGLVIVSLFSFFAPSRANADPISVIVVVVVAVTATAVYDYNSCGLNWIWGCPGNGGGSGNGSGNGGGLFGGILGPSQNAPGNQQNQNQNQGNNGPSFAPPPPPTPVIGTEGFFADPNRVRSGNTTTLHWDVEDATTCALSGGGLSLAGLSVLGEQVSEPITAKTEYTLTCENGAGGPTASAYTTVNLVPVFEEI